MPTPATYISIYSSDANEYKVSFYVVNIFSLKALLMLLGKVVFSSVSISFGAMVSFEWRGLSISCQKRNELRGGIEYIASHISAHVFSQAFHVFGFGCKRQPKKKQKTINSDQRFDGISYAKHI